MLTGTEPNERTADDRYNRWQGHGIAQLSVAIALISSLAVAGLGFGVSLLRDEKFIVNAPPKRVFASSLLLLLFAILFNCGAVITRLLDFGLTARKARNDKDPSYGKPLTMFWLGRDAYGRVTWGLFWSSCISFTLGMVLLAEFLIATYADRPIALARRRILQSKR